MAESVTPEITNKWVRMLLSVTAQGGPATLFFVIVLGGVMIYSQHHELARRVDINIMLANKVFDIQDRQIAWLLERVPCSRPDGER